MREITLHDNSENIFLFLLEETSLELDLNRSADKVDFINVEYNEAE